MQVRRGRERGEAQGGLELGSFDNCLIAEELAAGCSGISTCMEVNTLAEVPIVVAGNDDQKERFLAPMTESLRFASYAVTEPGAGKYR